jgi:hypothetical protein
MANASSRKRRRAPQAAHVQPHPTVGASVECIGPGEYRIREPRSYDPTTDAVLRRDPRTLAHEQTTQRLKDGNEDWPTRAVPPPPKTQAERRAERVETIRRVASGLNDYRQLLENEGFSIHEYPWAPSEDRRSETHIERRQRQELNGLKRSRKFGES